jgi:pimeloyl-ACP methyl ester carboxylesterase
MTAADSSPTSRVFFSQRLRLHYVDWGNAEAPPLILLHGGRDHCRNWDWVARDLRGDYHVIAPDLRGHGDSAWSASGQYSMANYIYDLAQLIHQQSLAPVTIIAHSLGGNIALRYSGIYPEMVRRLVAIEGLGPGPRSAVQAEGKSIAERMRGAAGAVGPAASALRHGGGCLRANAGGKWPPDSRTGSASDPAWGQSE